MPASPSTDQHRVLYWGATVARLGCTGCTVAGLHGWGALVARLRGWRGSPGTARAHLRRPPRSRCTARPPSGPRAAVAPAAGPRGRGPARSRARPGVHPPRLRFRAPQGASYRNRPAVVSKKLEPRPGALPEPRSFQVARIGGSPGRSRNREVGTPSLSAGGIARRRIRAVPIFRKTGPKWGMRFTGPPPAARPARRGSHRPPDAPGRPPPHLRGPRRA